MNPQEAIINQAKTIDEAMSLIERQTKSITQFQDLMLKANDVINNQKIVIETQDKLIAKYKELVAKYTEMTGV